MKIFHFLVIFLILFKVASAGENLKNHLNKVQLGGLDSILKKKYLRVLTTRNPYDYYIYQGKSMGLQHDMIKEFTKYLNKKYVKEKELRIVYEIIPVDFDQLIPMLNAGKGDIIAVGMTQTEQRNKLVDFTIPYILVDDVIVTRKNLDVANLDEKVFHVQKNSSYAKELLNQSYKTKYIDENFNPADLLEFISLGKYDYTLVNSFWAQTISKRFENLKIIKNKKFRKKVNVSWAVRKNNNKLLDELNSFLPKVKKGTLMGNLFSYKYFYNVSKIQSKDFDISKSIISKYDDIIKKYAKLYNIDWRLLAGLCYQESRFNQDIINKWGAIGLFQVKQMTANEPYVNIKNISGSENAENNIHAGVKYLAWIKNRYFDPKDKMSEDARLRMMMASYNAGPRRVQQAINKAKQMGLDPNKWFRNVELAMLELGYPEPVIYVSEINKHYVSYVLLGID